ncbi:hypothetical protein TNCV_70801 [Trichonephila clavipes]|nr:hypothetical protein TNCV_70801 [Trichonephila clavipes]
MSISTFRLVGLEKISPKHLWLLQIPKFKTALIKLPPDDCSKIRHRNRVRRFWQRSRYPALKNELRTISATTYVYFLISFGKRKGESEKSTDFCHLPAGWCLIKYVPYLLIELFLTLSPVVCPQLQIRVTPFFGKVPRLLKPCAVVKGTQTAGVLGNGNLTKASGNPGHP